MLASKAKIAKNFFRSFNLYVMKIGQIVANNPRQGLKYISPIFTAKPIAPSTAQKTVEVALEVVNSAVSSNATATIKLNNSQIDKKFKEKIIEKIIHKPVFDSIRLQIVDKVDANNYELVERLCDRYTWISSDSRPPIEEVLEGVNGINNENVDFLKNAVNSFFMGYRSLKSLIKCSTPKTIPALEYLLPKSNCGLECDDHSHIFNYIDFVINNTENVDFDVIKQAVNFVQKDNLKYAESLIYHYPKLGKDYNYYLENFYDRATRHGQSIDFKLFDEKNIPLEYFAEAIELRACEAKNHLGISIPHFIKKYGTIEATRKALFNRLLETTFILNGKDFNPEIYSDYISEVEKFLESDVLDPLQSAVFIENVSPQNIEILKYLCKKDSYFAPNQVESLVNDMKYFSLSSKDYMKVKNFAKKFSKDPDMDNVMLTKLITHYCKELAENKTDDVDEIFYKMFNYYKHVEQNRENYVSAVGYEPYETFFNNIPSLFILFKNYEKRTIDALFNKRLNTVVDYMKELSSFGGNGSEWLLKNLMMSKEVDGRKLSEDEQLNILRIIKAYNECKLDDAKLYDMAWDRTIDLRAIYENLYSQLFKFIGMSDDEISKIPEEKLYSWDIKYMPLLFKSMDNNKQAFKELIKASMLGNFMDYLHDKNNRYGNANLETQRKFKATKLHYDKWLNPSKANEIRFVSTNESNEQLIHIGEKLVEDIETLRKTPVKKFFDRRYAEYIKDGAFTIPNHILKSKTKLESFVKNILTQLEPAWKRAEKNSQSSDESKVLQAGQTLTIKEHFEQRIKDVREISDEKKEQVLDITIKMWDRIPQKDLFQGNYSTCCIRIGGANGYIMPNYIMNTAFNMIELVDNLTGKVIGNALCYFIKGLNDEPSLVIDNIEINNAYIPSEKVGKKLLDSITQYAINVCKEVTGKTTTPIYLGISNNDLKVEKGVQELRKFFIGDIDCQQIYLDAYNGWIYNDALRSDSGALYKLN